METRQPSSNHCLGRTIPEARPIPEPRDLERSVFCPIQVRYLEASQVVHLFQTPQNYIAGLVCFGKSLFLNGQETDHIPVVNIPLAPFKKDSYIEVWSGEHPFIYVQEESIQVACNQHYLFGSVQGWESSALSLEDLTCATYQLILDQISELGYPHLFRVWNYFPEINLTNHGLERYQQFCKGRHQAFSSQTKKFQTVLPAATAVGTPSGSLQINFLAGKQPGNHIENPRQMSAYEYPDFYGPKSPSFSRATMAIAENHHHLFLAGTASIIGHATQHPGNPAKQTQETLRNIDAVVRHAQEIFPVPGSLAERQSLAKVYIRNREHFCDIEEIVTDHLGDSLEVLYLQGDICRNDLLVEIEAIFHFP